MREIINVQLGQSGNSIGFKFWEVIANEHGINNDGRWLGVSKLQHQRLNIFFTEAQGEKFVPRAILVDPDPISKNLTELNSVSRLFNPENVITGESGASNNWAAGYYTEGSLLINEALDAIRREAESCDLVQGFQLIHSLGGGTGSGTTSLLLSKIYENFPKKIIATFSVLPSLLQSQGSETSVETCNAVLTFRHLVEFSNSAFLIDNQALKSICLSTLRLEDPSYDDMNHLVALCMAGTTACLRFPGQLNADMRKINVNMVPFPRLHFFVPGYAPLVPKSVQPYRTISVAELTHQIFDPKLAFVRCSQRQRRFLAFAAIFRGRLSTKEVDEKMLACKNKNSQFFVEWIPSSIKTAICDIANQDLKMSVTTIANTTAIQEPLEKILNECEEMLKKKVSVDTYSGKGMEKTDFDEALRVIRDLISEYQECQEAKVEDQGAEENER